MFDEATAILVGDAFQTLAFQILADKKRHIMIQIKELCYKWINKSSGCEGMVGGQMLDLERKKKN